MFCHELKSWDLFNYNPLPSFIRGVSFVPQDTVKNRPYGGVRCTTMTRLDYIPAFSSTPFRGKAT
jgi:hypothetical protein